MEVRIPGAVGVDRITVRRGRAEVSEIEVMFEIRGNTWITDNTIRARNDKKYHPYRMKNPDRFRQRKGGFQLFIKGKWRHNTTWFSMSKESSKPYLDRMEIKFYSGHQDANPNTVVRIYYTKPIPASALPPALSPSAAATAKR